jgi:hypothetical protein
MKKIIALTMFLFVFVATSIFFPSVSPANETVATLLKTIVNQDGLDRNSASLAACLPYHDYLYGPLGGISYMTGTICDASAQLTFEYINFALLPNVITNGQVQCHIVLNDPYYPTQMNFTFNSGPLYYDISGALFTTYFYDFTIIYHISDLGLTITNVSGGLTVNDQYITASAALAEVLF